MGDNSLTVRGKKWERKNSMWILWSIFLLAGVGFIKIGRKAKEKKWIAIGIFYLVFLLLGPCISGVFNEAVMEVYVTLFFLVYIGSIVHSFLVKKAYLIKYDKVLHKQEIELEEEKIKRNIQEQELIQQRKNIELKKMERLKEYEQLKDDNEQIDTVDEIEQENERNDSFENKIKENNDDKEQNETSENKISIVKVAVVIFVAILLLRGGCSFLGFGGNGIEGTYVHRGEPSSSITITDEGFTWYIDAFGGYNQIDNSPYTIDEENNLIKVDDSNFDFYYATDENGNVVWIARVVDGITQEKHYK